MAEPCSVLKFGGSSVANPERMHRVARIIQSHYRKNPKLVVVVSAMGDTTDELIDLALKVSPQAKSSRHKREMDMLLSSGERISMALLSMALADLGLPAISLTGSQSGIITTTVHGEARISEIKPIRIHEALAENKIVIVAGFQGVSQQKEITTLGRGGSDTSAVALGVALKAQEVFIYTDVAGFFSADPRKVPQARAIPHISWSHAYKAALKGAVVLHPRCLELALNHEIPVRVLSSFVEPQENPHFASGGTFIKGKDFMNNLEGSRIHTVSSQGGLSLVGANNFKPEQIVQILNKIQQTHVKYVWARSFETSLQILVAKDAVSELAQIFKANEVHHNLALMSVIGSALTQNANLNAWLEKRVPSLGALQVNRDESNLEILLKESLCSPELLQEIHAALYT